MEIQPQRTAAERTRIAKEFISAHYTQADTIRTRYTSFHVKTQIERSGFYVSNEDVYTALTELGFKLRPSNPPYSTKLAPYYINIPGTEIRKVDKEYNLGRGINIDKRKFR